MKLTGANFIGPTASTRGSKTYRALNPALNTEIDPPFHQASAEEINQAMNLADRAFADYRNRPPRDRAAFLRTIAANIESLGDDLITRASAETALPAARLTGERARTCNQLKMFADLIEEGSWVDARIDHADPNRKPIPKPDVRRMRIALGPVVVFPPSNFPLAYSVAGGDTASALAAGCPVIIKCHPSHPGTSELVLSATLAAAKQHNMPDGVISLLHAVDNESSLAIVRHPAAAAVGFTGSLRAGRAIFDAACARPTPIPVYAEMGSTNPVFILPRALANRADQIAQGLKDSLTLGVGQYCTNPGIVIAIDSPAGVQLRKKLADLISTDAPGTMLNRNIATVYAAGRAQISKIPGVTVAAQAAATQAAEKLPNSAAAIVFTTTTENFLANHRLREEIFGPTTIMVTAHSHDDLLQIAQRLDGQLTATIHADGDDLAEHRDLIELLKQKVGRLIFNAYPTGLEVCPAMVHGGPYPATTDSRTTSVGSTAIERFARPVCFQNCPQDELPPELQDNNPKKIWRLVDNNFTR